MTIDRIKALAKEKGISLSFICGKLGLARNYLSEVKNGKTKLTDDRLAIIADILNTTPEYLKGETDQKERPQPLDSELEQNEELELFMKYYVPLSTEQKKIVLAQMQWLKEREDNQ